MRKILLMTTVLVVIPLIFGCGDSTTTTPTVPSQTRFVSENSDWLPFSLYRDKKTGRLYAYSGYGGLTKIDETPVETEAEKK